MPHLESSATNTLERPLKRRKSRGSRGSRNKRKGEAGGEITPKRQSREYRDEVNRMKRNSKKKNQHEPPEVEDTPVPVEVDQPPARDENIQQQAAGLSRNRKRSSKKRAQMQQGGNSLVLNLFLSVFGQFVM